MPTRPRRRKPCGGPRRTVPRLPLARLGCMILAGGLGAKRAALPENSGAPAAVNVRPPDPQPGPILSGVPAADAILHTQSSSSPPAATTRTSGTPADAAPGPMTDPSASPPAISSLPHASGIAGWVAEIGEQIVKSLSADLGPKATEPHSPAKTPEGEAGRVANWRRRAYILMKGSLIIALGVIMLVLPGPGWVTIGVGLWVLSQEFVWARRLLQWIGRQLLRVHRWWVQSIVEPWRRWNRKSLPTDRDQPTSDQSASNPPATDVSGPIHRPPANGLTQNSV